MSPSASAFDRRRGFGPIRHDRATLNFNSLFNETIEAYSFDNLTKRQRVALDEG